MIENFFYMKNNIYFIIYYLCIFQSFFLSFSCFLNLVKLKIKKIYLHKIYFKRQYKE